MNRETKINDETKIGVAQDGFSSAMSVAEFCQRYRIGRSMVYLENKAGRLTFRKVGTRTLIMRA